MSGLEFNVRDLVDFGLKRLQKCLKLTKVSGVGAVFRA